MNPLWSMWMPCSRSGQSYPLPAPPQALMKLPAATGCSRPGCCSTYHLAGMAEKASGRLKLAGNMKANACPLLQIADHAEEILGLRVPPRAKHADEAFGRRARRCTELLETDGGL